LIQDVDGISGMQQNIVSHFGLGREHDAGAPAHAAEFNLGLIAVD
jgi:hypothetical protein